MGTRKDDEVRTAVRKQHGKLAEQGGGCGCAPSCCGTASDASMRIGYTSAPLSSTQAPG